MCFKNIYKTLGTTGTEQDENKKRNLQEILPSVALTNLIFEFQSQFRSFIVPIQVGYRFTKRAYT